VATYDKEYKFHRIILPNPLNKQTSSTSLKSSDNNKPWDPGKFTSRVASLYHFKSSNSPQGPGSVSQHNKNTTIFNSNIKKYDIQTINYSPYMGVGKQLTEIAPEETQMLDYQTKNSNKPF
jgi:hypothetical protein